MPLQYTSLLSILASALLMMLQRCGMICLMMCHWPLLSTHSERTPQPISLYKHTHPNFCFSQYLSMTLTCAMVQVNYYSSLLFLCTIPIIIIELREDNVPNYHNRSIVLSSISEKHFPVRISFVFFCNDCPFPFVYMLLNTYNFLEYK